MRISSWWFSKGKRARGEKRVENTSLWTWKMSWSRRLHLEIAIERFHLQDLPSAIVVISLHLLSLPFLLCFLLFLFPSSQSFLCHCKNCQMIVNFGCLSGMTKRLLVLFLKLLKWPASTTDQICPTGVKSWPLLVAAIPNAWIHFQGLPIQAMPVLISSFLVRRDSRNAVQPSSEILVELKLICARSQQIGIPACQNWSGRRNYSSKLMVKKFNR